MALQRGVLNYVYAHHQEDLHWSVYDVGHGQYPRILVVEYTGNLPCEGICVSPTDGSSTMNLGSPFNREPGIEARNPKIGIIHLNFENEQNSTLNIFSSPDSRHWIVPAENLALGVHPNWYLGTITVTNIIDNIPHPVLLDANQVNRFVVQE